ncbi:hypothetical protein [Thetidibacter halocola]|uniref:DUF1127 domain-containing protein n=1 Tax=Thetidibacter halocola TaxID=2827239 RepID=A0A8J7WFP0_9RHOB|nr:hypothetical protein [Thetidibacter halocola]MBS0125952.1 hypothetical protein [Thetidibacter halocola]
MDRILSIPRLARPRTGLIAMILRRVGHVARIRADAARIDALPRDRLEDMGLSPRTEANRRDSGQAGPPPRAPLW